MHGDMMEISVPTSLFRLQFPGCADIAGMVNDGNRLGRDGLIISRIAEVRYHS